MAFSTDGTLIAYPAASGHQIQLINGRTEQVVATIPAQDAWQALAFSPDGTRLAILGADLEIDVFDVSTGQLVTQIRSLSTAGASSSGEFAYIDHGAAFLVGGHGLVVVSASTGKILRTIIPASHFVTGLAVNPNKTQAAVVEGAGVNPIRLGVYSIASWCEAEKLPPPGGTDREAYYPAWSADGKSLAVSTGSAVSVYEGTKLIAHLGLSSVNARAVGWLPDGVVVISDFDRVELWNPLQRRLLADVLVETNANGPGPTAVAMSPDGSEVAITADFVGNSSLIRLLTS